jgi:nondiscriminating glutamyl-tRNA synthetase
MMVRVRFAPSPTGDPHIGNIHTALFNWLLARSQEGRFVLRVEDTDVARYSEGALDKMMDGLRWLGLDWDEGPDKGGPYAPYVQSQRLGLYRHWIEHLLKQGKAYRCFCSPQRLDTRRQEMVAKGQPPRYSGRCRYLTPTECAREEARGVASVVRLKSPLEGQTPFHDLLRGPLTFSNRDLDDTILLKSDGYPTYHLASVIDDHLMDITHVLRGEEWISSTPWHILLYQAFGWEPPQFVHLPLILNSDRSKLSKRVGSSNLNHYLEVGYLPEALVNYLALLGWSPPSAGAEVLSPQELTAQFALDRLSRSSSILDLERLDWFNKQHLKRHSPAAVVALTKPYLQSAFGRVSCHEGTALGETEWRETFATATRDEMATLQDVVELGQPLFEDNFALTEEAKQALLAVAAPDVLSALAADLPGLEPFTYDAVNLYLRALRYRFKTERALAGREVMFPIRAALTGTLKGPCLVVLAILLGKERCLSRIRAEIQTS